MGTSYEPPEQDENRAPNPNNMLQILEQEMQKGFGGGIPAFLKNEVNRMNIAKSTKAEKSIEVLEESKEQKNTENKKKKAKNANGEGWEEFKDNRPKKDDNRIKSNAEKINIQFERYYKQLEIVPKTEWYDFYAILKQPLDICFRINSIE